MTLHSFAGIGLGEDPIGVSIGRVKRSPVAAAKWKECRVLVIDEISMIPAELFDKLEIIARYHDTLRVAFI